MRTLIFALMLMAANCFAAPQPNVRINPWSTNDWPDPVKGTNSLSVSNTIPGGSLWNFYGTNAQTVARLGDIASSNVNYVLKFNGPSDGQIATNLTAVNFNVDTNNIVEAGDVKFQLFSAGSIFHLYDFGATDDLITGDYGSGLTFHTTIAGYGAGLNVASAQTNSNTLDVAGDITAYGALISLNGFSSSLSSTFTGGIKLNSLTPSRLMAITSAGYATNSVYSDADIAALQAGVQTTNKYILSNAGLGTNNTFYSATNTAQASNQVVATFKGVTGHTNNIIEIGTNDASGNMIRQTVFKANGNIGIGTSTPNQPLEVIGIITNSGSIFTGNSLNVGSGGTIGDISRGNFRFSGSGTATWNGNNLTAIGTLASLATTVSQLTVTNKIFMLTNSAFVAPVSGQVILCTSNYDIYVITPTKTNLFAVGQ